MLLQHPYLKLKAWVRRIGHPNQMRLSPLLVVLCYVSMAWTKKISRQERRKLVMRFNPTRRFDASTNVTTPMQVGNGNFAFGADVTSLQTFQPFSIMSNWGWKTDAYPVGRTKEDIEAYKGVSWLNHGRPVQYDFGGPPDIEAWLRSNPNRANLGRIGLSFWEEGWQETQTVTLAGLKNGSQTLDLWTGRLESTFQLFGAPVSVQTACDPDSDTVAIVVSSPLIKKKRLGLFVDYPWNEGSSKFSAPFVGFWDKPESHTTQLSSLSGPYSRFRITQKANDDVFFTHFGGDITIRRHVPEAHRYFIFPTKATSTLALTVHFGKEKNLDTLQMPSKIISNSAESWDKYWTETGFVDLTQGPEVESTELQRRIVLSRYLLRVNEAGDLPPQEVSYL